MKVTLQRFSNGDNDEPETLGEVFLVQDPMILVCGSDVALKGKRYNLFRIDEHIDEVIQSRDIAISTNMKRFELLMFGYIGDGLWQKYRARCEQES